jgi:hypothetical protein
VLQQEELEIERVGCVLELEALVLAAKEKLVDVGWSRHLVLGQR